MSTINFTTKLLKINSTTLLLVPKNESAKLPSRGQVMVKGTINNFSFQTALEPDGRGSHWLKVDQAMLKGAHANEGDTVKMAIEPSKDWPEPKVPEDIQKGVATRKEIHPLWEKITPMARWDWIRWIGSTKNPETRKHHIEVACDKLGKGMKRPCCFNRTLCCDFSVCNNGVLPEQD